MRRKSLLPVALVGLIVGRWSLAQDSVSTPHASASASASAPATPPASSSAPIEVRVVGERRQRSDRSADTVRVSGDKLRASPKATLLEALAQEHDPYWLHDKLRVIDPSAAGKIDARNVRRTVRALEVIFSTGRRFSAQGGVSDSPYRLISVGLIRPRPELYARIDQRIESMFANGLLNEVQTLLDQGYPPTLPTLSAIGYRECVAVLQGAMTLDEAKTQIKKLTLIFVRRQSNWFKENDPQIAWFEMGAGTATEVENYLRKKLIEGIV